MESIAEFIEVWPDFLSANLMLFASLTGAAGIGVGLISKADSRGGQVATIVEFARPAWHAFLRGFRSFYDSLCGVHPHRRMWHSQWLSVKDLYRDLRRILSKLEGPLLDLGSATKPYAAWMPKVREHIGADVFPGEKVDVVIREGESWPLESNRFQSVLCTQVLEVVRDVPHLLDEVHRVLAPGGIAVISTPFCYNDMSGRADDGGYKDYWRHTENGVMELLGTRFEVVEVRRQGGVGSTLGVMLLNWIGLSAGFSPITQFLLVVLLPFWLLLSVFVNVTGYLLDKLDRTNAFYHNVLVVVRKPRID